MAGAPLCLILAGVVFALQTGVASPDCPRLCECKWKSGKESVVCLNANLSSVPLLLDAGTQILDLTGNNVATIKHDEFSAAGLLNLQKIYVAKCRLKTLDRYAFRNLINLVELDLSFNVLTGVPSHAFDSVPELRELKLNGNPIQRIANDAFVHVPQLVRLELSDCKLNAIESRGFRGLESSLEWLKLDRNKLADVQGRALVTFENLHGLELAGNPWNCSCSLRPLREWMLRQNVPFSIPPTCKHPQRLAGKSWDKLDLDEFACRPEVETSDTKTQGVEGRNITMSCRVNGSPEPKVRWMLKNRVIANLSSPALAATRKLYVVHLQDNASNLTIMTADLQDAGVYVCSAENKAGRAEASVTLAVARKPAEEASGGRTVFAGAILAVVLMFLLIIVAGVYSVKKRHTGGVLAQNLTQDCDDSYEKIEMNHKPIVVRANNVAANGANCVNREPIVNPPRRNCSSYKRVPISDNDDEEDLNKFGRDSKIWMSSLNAENVDARAWKSSSCDAAVDLEDLHIPRRRKYSERDDLNANTSAMGAFAFAPDPTKYNSAASGAPLATVLTSHVMRKQILPETGGSLYTSVHPAEDADPQYPDLLEMPSSKYGSGEVALLRRGYNSDGGGSGSDVSSSTNYCTVPRKKSNLARGRTRHHSNDSQSPLLPDSRCGSSGGESDGFLSTTRRLSVDSHKKYSNAPGRVGQRSNSYLNLVSPNCNSAQIVGPSPTPLLDVSNLEARVKDHLKSPTANSKTAAALATTYDYHAAQLERFLEEYRTLQKQLNKMKETCNTIRQESLSNSRFLDPLLHNNVILACEDANPRSILKKTPPAVMTSPTPSTHLPPPPAAGVAAATAATIANTAATLDERSNFWTGKNPLRFNDNPFDS